MKQSILDFLGLTQIVCLMCGIMGEVSQTADALVIGMISLSVLCGMLYQLGDSKELSDKIKEFKAHIEKVQADARRSSQGD